MAVRVSDIARRAGVAQSTVSAALHGRGRVGSACRERITRIATEMGYEPQLAAQLLRARKTSHLGAVVAASDAPWAFAHEVQRLVLGHFVQTCDRLNQKYMIAFHHHRDDGQGSFVPPQQITSRLVDGSLLIGDVGDRLRQWLRERQTHPWVSIEEPAEHCVLSAAEQGVRQAVEMLAAMGHRRFAYGGGPDRYSQQRLGRRGFAEATAELRLPAEEQMFSGVLDAARAQSIIEWARALLVRPATGEPARPTAFICHGESTSRAVIHAATERGLKVPGDLSVISYGAAIEAVRRYPHLTTIENDYQRITELAIELLRRLVAADEAVAPSCIWVAPRLVPGITHGPAPR